MDWEKAHDIEESLHEIVRTLGFTHLQLDRIFCYRTYGSKARAYARCWAFPKIFQDALSEKPAYVIEVLSKHFDKLPEDEKKKIIIHELLHIPKNFSGALLPHQTRHRKMHTEVNRLFKEYLKNR